MASPFPTRKRSLSTGKRAVEVDAGFPMQKKFRSTRFAPKSRKKKQSSINALAHPADNRQQPPAMMTVESSSNKDSPSQSRYSHAHQLTRPGQHTLSDYQPYDSRIVSSGSRVSIRKCMENGYEKFEGAKTDCRERINQLQNRKKRYGNDDGSEQRMYREKDEPPRKSPRIQPGDNPNTLKFLKKLTSSSRPLSQLSVDRLASILQSNSVEILRMLFRILCRLSKEHRDNDQMSSYYIHLFRPQKFRFLQLVSEDLCSMPQEGNPTKRIKFLEVLGDTIHFFGELLRKHPHDACVSLPIDSCCGAVEQLASQDLLFQEMKEKARRLKMLRDEKRNESYETFRDKHRNLEDHIALPTLEDLLLPCIPDTLKPNIVDGPYPSSSEYISIHFSLMREDFNNPLREALQKITKNEEETYLSLYERVEFKSSCTLSSQSDDVMYKLSFSLPIDRYINWEKSKKMTFGSLLCLSEDDFKSIIFATVAERDVDDLKKHTVTVKLQGNAASYVNTSKAYRMFESPHYYEAYAPVIRRLNGLDPKQLPFQQYLVNCKTQVDMPAYLRGQDTTMNLHGVICSCDNDCAHESIDVKNEDQWIQTETDYLDSSQKTALHTALTKELVLIQGPPGTGKTYIGLKIVQSLLINKSLWTTRRIAREKTPILVVCYTNHALDQFLEGLLKLKETCDDLSSLEIRRLGGRCKSPIVEPYNVKKFVKIACRAQGIPPSSRNQLMRRQHQHQALEHFLKGDFDTSKEAITMYSFFLSEHIIDCITHACGLETHLPDLSNWPLLIPGGAEHRANDNPYHNDMEADRQVSMDDDTSGPKFPIFEERSLRDFVRYFRKVDPLTEKRASEFLMKDTELEPLPQLQLFKYCLTKLRDNWQEQIQVGAELNAKEERKRELIKINCLQVADVIGVTTTGAAKFSTALSQVKSKICVIEEAAEVLEAHVLTSLTSHTQQLILIGDHKQLQPKTNDYTIGRTYKFAVSLFERLVRNDFPHVTLEVQHRMRPEISALVSKNIYSGLLKDSASTTLHRDVKGMKHNLYFVDHSVPETLDPESNSKSNEHEAEFIVCLYNYLLQNGYKPEQITIITPYLGQLFSIRSRLKCDSGVRVSTIDNYQGEENKIVLLSLVRSNKENITGFIKDDNRVCVAMSRAKAGFYCIGDFSLLRKSSKLWKSIVIDLEERECLGKSLPLQCKTHQVITEVTRASDFKEKASEGGCDQICNVRLKVCNHTCPRKCHPDQSQHSQTLCNWPCPNQCINNLHRCKRKCGEECNLCIDLVEKRIPTCGHNQHVPCHMPPEEYTCKKKCQKKLSCGHPCKLKCGEDCESKPCGMLVTREWPCGHKAQKECHLSKHSYSLSCSFPCGVPLECGHVCTGKCGQCRQGRLHIRCKKECTRVLLCGHLCSESCASNCPPCKKECPFKCTHAPCGNKCSTICKPCPHTCEWSCEHYTCIRNCGDLCARPRCSAPCKKKLKCGHNCIGLCGEPCPNVCRVCNKDSDTFEIFFGPEDEDDSHFIKLKDCSHLFEVNSLDEWVDKDSEAVGWKKCPRCNIPIISTARYADSAKNILKDMNAIKKKQNYHLSEYEKTHLRTNIRQLCQDTRKCDVTELRSSQRYFVKTRLEHFEEGISEDTDDTYLQNVAMSVQSLYECLSAIQKLRDMCVHLSYDDKLEELKVNIQNLKFQIIDFLDWIISYLKRKVLTDQMQKDMHSETRRINLLKELYFVESNIILYRVDLPDSDLIFLNSLHKYECLGNKPDTVSDDFLKSSKRRLRDISLRCQVPLSEEERSMIIQALQTKKGSWYKCPNGHYYQIGQCGGAMETSKCPECSAEIGGAHHSLVPGNQHAGEFDNSEHAAWSEGANMGNYDL